MPEVHDPYRVLGLRRDATSSEIKAAHRKLAKRHHPDAIEGDTERFLAIQDAYRVLIDPLTRRDWDRQHAPGPARADDASAVRGPAAPPRRAASAADRARRRPVRPDEGRTRSTGGSAASRGYTASDRYTGSSGYTGSGGYTWSAREVPWWEDPLAPREARRPPGRRRATRPAAKAPAPENVPPPPPAEGEPAGREEVADRAATEPVMPDMDVYNRSSGAAWSQAARAYFRRHDLPPPGRRSAWRARVAPDVTAGAPSTRRAHADAPTETSAPRPSDEMPARSRRAPPPRDGRAAPPAAHPRFRGASPAPAAGPAASPAPAAGTAAANLRRAPGAADAPAASSAPGSRPRRAPAPSPRSAPAGITARSPFPTFAERGILAAIAWLPIAIVVAYGGGSVTGCGRAAASCSPLVEPLQLSLAGAAYVALLAAPRLSWFCATGAVAALAAGMALLFALAAIGVELAVAGAALVAISIAVYVAAVIAATRDWPFPRPWLARPHAGTPA